MEMYGIIIYLFIYLFIIIIYQKQFSRCNSLSFAYSIIH